jgi:hypothetical protein
MGKQLAEPFKKNPFTLHEQILGSRNLGPLRCRTCLLLQKLVAAQYNDTTCTTAAVWAGATPRTFWAAGGQKSGVAPARFGVFFQGASSFPAFRISDSGKKLLAPQAEERTEEEAEECSFCLLQVFFLRFACRNRDQTDDYTLSNWEAAALHGRR